MRGMGLVVPEGVDYEGLRGGFNDCIGGAQSPVLASN